jgi:hypothetical protein
MLEIEAEGERIFSSASRAHFVEHHHAEQAENLKEIVNSIYLFPPSHSKNTERQRSPYQPSSQPASGPQLQ